MLAFDGVGTLPDGTLVGFANPRPPYGALAEKTVVSSKACAPIPEGIDPAVATVLATAIIGMSITTAGGFVAGETVLVQGATGSPGDLRSRSPGCWAPGGSSRPAVTTISSAKCRPSVLTP